MLNKEICKKCIREHFYPDNNVIAKVLAGEFDWSRWENSWDDFDQVSYCLLLKNSSSGAHVHCSSKIPKNCKYFLEQTMAMQKEFGDVE